LRKVDRSDDQGQRQQQLLVDNIFTNAFDEFNDINRKLFEIPEIDKFLSFSNKKNICIQNQIHGNNNFLHHIIAKICISYHLAFDSRSCSNKSKEKRTILIDAGNGNNLGSIYLNLTKLTIEKEIDINILLDSIMIVRAFTFYQLANIIVNELPRFINQLGNKIQIILLDLFDTLVSSSSSMKKTKDSVSSNEIEDNIDIVNELIDILISLSEKYFVILTYNEAENMICNSSRSLASKFDNAIKIKQVYEKKEKTVEIELLTHSRNQATNTVNNRKELAPINMFTDSKSTKKIILNQL
jgi:hypothetical protein